MKKVVLFGSGNVGEKVYTHMKDRIAAVIDNNPSKIGKEFKANIPIISIEEYLTSYSECEILLCSVYAKEMERQLEELNIHNYTYAIEIYKRYDVSIDKEIQHQNWIHYLTMLCDKPGFEVLEVGSRRLNKADKWHEQFQYANYTGFDLVAGENVDVVGDAHRLSSYFDKKFDLIFSSAVFEHL